MSEIDKQTEDTDGHKKIMLNEKTNKQTHIQKSRYKAQRNSYVLRRFK